MVSFFGTVIGLLIYFVLIPYYAQGELSHQHHSFFSSKYIDLKILMMARVHLAMGFFVLLWPRVFLITLPLYSLYLLGGL